MVRNNKLSDDAKMLTRAFSSVELKALAEEAERLEKARSAMTELAFDIAHLLGIEQANKGDPSGKKWAREVFENVKNLTAEARSIQKSQRLGRTQSQKLLA